MHLSWQKHLELSRIVSNAADKDSGTGLALMGIALTILAKDLLMYETRSSVTSTWREIGLSWAIIQARSATQSIMLCWQNKCNEEECQQDKRFHAALIELSDDVS